MPEEFIVADNLDKAWSNFDPIYPLPANCPFYVEREDKPLRILYDQIGSSKKAIEYYEKALAISQEIGDRRGEGNSLNNLGVAFENTKKYKEALACYLHAKDIRTEIKDPNLKTTESNIRELKEKLGDKEFKKLEAEVVPKAEEIVKALLDKK